MIHLTGEKKKKEKRWMEAYVIHVARVNNIFNTRLKPTEVFFVWYSREKVKARIQ